MSVMLDFKLSQLYISLNDWDRTNIPAQKTLDQITSFLARGGSFYTFCSLYACSSHSCQKEHTDIVNNSPLQVTWKQSRSCRVQGDPNVKKIKLSRSFAHTPKYPFVFLWRLGSTPLFCNVAMVGRYGGCYDGSLLTSNLLYILSS